MQKTPTSTATSREINGDIFFRAKNNVIDSVKVLQEAWYLAGFTLSWITFIDGLKSKSHILNLLNNQDRYHPNLKHMFFIHSHNMTILSEK